MAILASDDFNRADSITIGAPWSLGANFINIPGVFSNQVDRSPGGGGYCGAYHSGVTWPDDGYSQAKFVGLADLNDQAVTYRMASAAVTTYYAGGHCSIGFGGTAKLARIWKLVAGVQVSLATGAGTIAAGDTVRLFVQGTTLTLFVNGVSVCSASDASIASGNAGMYFAHSLEDVGLFDLFEGGDAVTFLYPQAERNHRGISRGVSMGVG